MSYRGDDLDLRTPQPVPGDLSATQSTDPFVVAHRARSSSAHRGAPIWVDDTVLDCCNHAFDVASAHRASEVQLEHLIYALTRIEDAAEVLEERGLRVAGLRREAATFVATEIPAVSGNGKSTPRRSDSFEEVLRLAAGRAYRRQAPVGVTDIVYALFDSGVEFRSLARLVPGGLPRPIAPPPESIEPEIISEPRSRAPSKSQRGLASDLTGIGAAQSHAQTHTQNSRIDSVEQSIRTLTTELAKERQILSGVLQDLQRELMAQREDSSRHGGLTQDKIQSVYGDRLHSLEQAFLSARNPQIGNGDTGPLQDRLALLERALQSEISITRSAVENLASRSAVDLGPLLDRLEVIEVSASADRENAEANAQKLSADLDELSAALDRQPGEIAALVSNPLTEQLNTQHAAATDGLAEAHRRLGALEEALNAFVARSESAIAVAAQERAGLREDVTRLIETISQESASGQESFSRFTETLTQDLSEVHDGLAKISTNQHTLATTFDVQAIDSTNAFTAIAARIESLEKAAAKPVEMLDALSATVEKMHKITVEKYYRRNRFWFWLFGTDDWLAASWPSQSARIAEELRSIKH
jgi:hypothetical protein